MLSQLMYACDGGADLGGEREKRQHSVLSGRAGNDSNSLARNKPGHRSKVPGRRLSERKPGKRGHYGECEGIKEPGERLLSVL